MDQRAARALVHAARAAQPTAMTTPSRHCTTHYWRCRCDEESNVRLIAATHLIARGQKERALEILRAPIDSAEVGENGWELTRKMDLLVKAGAAQEAVALFQRRQDVRFYSRGEAARYCLQRARVSSARRELAEADETSETPRRRRRALPARAGARHGGSGLHGLSGVAGSWLGSGSAGLQPLCAARTRRLSAMESPRCPRRVRLRRPLHSARTACSRADRRSPLPGTRSARHEWRSLSPK